MKNRKVPLFLTLASTVLFAVLQTLAQFLHFYWLYWWFDWLMHFLAGFIGALAIFWVFYYLWLWRRKSDKILLPVFAIVVCLLIVGGAWEIAEYALDITDAHEAKYIDDVRNDLISDLVGATLGAIIGVKYIMRRREDSPLETTNG